MLLGVSTTGPRLFAGNRFGHPSSRRRWEASGEDAAVVWKQKVVDG